MMLCVQRNMGRIGRDIRKLLVGESCQGSIRLMSWSWKVVHISFGNDRLVARMIISTINDASQGREGQYIPKSKCTRAYNYELFDKRLEWMA